MTFRLAEISAQAYAEHVLPLTHELWGAGRAPEIYCEQTGEIAQSTYGRKSYRTVALTVDGRSVSTFKRYEREAYAGKERLRSVGIGAVFTPPALRGQGFASAMLGMALDEARAADVDFAFLFSDIHPQFYKQLGFAELPSRSISFRADSLEYARIDAKPVMDGDWTGLRRCFEAMERSREFGFTRSAPVWNWMRMRVRHASVHQHAQPVHLAVHRGRTLAAYVLGQREPRHDAYVLDELGYADENGRALIPALLRSAAGDLRRIAGWLPPAPARSVLPRGSVRRRSDAVWMLAPLTAGGTRFLERAKRGGAADGVWSLDHV